jgi:hypothetical protein
LYFKGKEVLAMIIRIHGIESIEESRRLCSLMKAMSQEKKLKVGEISNVGLENHPKHPYLEVIFQGSDEQVELVKEALHEYNIFMEIRTIQM